MGMRIENWCCHVPQGRLIQAAIVTTLVAAGPAYAEFDYGLSLGAGHSDNIARTEDAETSETIGTAGVDLTWREQSRRIDADVNVDLSYAEYLDDTFDSEVLGTADGFVVLGIVPDRFTWLFEDSFGQAQADPFEPSTPETRENINYFTTGPDFIFRLGSSAFVRLFGRYAAVNYEDSPFDAERTSGGVAIGRRLSRSSELAFNAVSERIDNDNPLSTDFDREHAFVSYEFRGSRTELTTELGYTWLDRAGEETGGALVSLSLSRELSSSSIAVIGLGTQFTDAGESLRATAGQVGGGAITATADPFENRFASLGWDFTRNRTGISLGASWNEDRYEGQTLLDRTRFVYNATFTRRLSAALEFGLYGMLTEEEFDSTGLTADELTLGTSLTWQAGRTLGISLRLDRSDRDTSPDVGGYVENRVFLIATYRPRGSAGSRRR